MGYGSDYVDEIHDDLRAARTEAASLRAEVERLTQALAGAEERIKALEEGLEKRAEWHKCSCPEPCDDFGVFPGGCAGRYRQDYQSLLNTAGSR